LSIFTEKNIDATLLCPLIFLGSASILYILLYRRLFFCNVLDLILYESNKGYCSCPPCHHFHRKLGTFVYFVATFYSNPVLVCSSKKNLAILFIWRIFCRKRETVPMGKKRFCIN
jgi:hypothetical protein